MDNTSSEKEINVRLRLKPVAYHKIKRAAKRADMSINKFICNHAAAAADVVNAKTNRLTMTAPGAATAAPAE